MIERRRHFAPVTELPFAPVTNNCKWTFRGSLFHTYAVAMGWTLLVEEADGMLWQAPADFNETGVRAL
jgi:hypothetical protein